MAKCMKCGLSIGPFDRKVKFNEGPLCIECFKNLGIPGVSNDLSYEETKKNRLVAKAEFAFDQTDYSQLQKYLANLKADEERPYIYRVGNLARFDDGERILCLADRPRYSNYEASWQRIPYDHIVDFELLRDGTSIGQGVGATVAGGLLFGVAGAIVGNAIGKNSSSATCSSLSIKIATSDQSQPVVYLNLIKEKTQTSSKEYEYLFDSAQRILAKLQMISAEQPKEEPIAVKVPSAADEILKFKKLADEGIITSEEFEAKKRQLLDL